MGQAPHGLQGEQPFGLVIEVAQQFASGRVQAVGGVQVFRPLLGQAAQRPQVLAVRPGVVIDLRRAFGGGLPVRPRRGVLTGLLEMGRDAGRMVWLPVPRGLGQQRAQLPVDQAPARGRHVAQQGVAVQVVAEPEAARPLLVGRCVGLEDQVRSLGLFEHLDRLPFSQAADAVQRGPERFTGHRRRVQQAPGRVAQPRDPGHHGGPHVLRNGNLGVVGGVLVVGGLPQAVLGAQLARFPQRLQRLEQKQRVSGGRLIQPPREERRGLPRQPRDQPLDLRRAEFVKRQPDQVGRALQVEQNRSDLLARQKVACPATEEHADAGLLLTGGLRPRAPDQPRHHAQGRCVEPVQVLGHQDAVAEHGLQGVGQGQRKGLPGLGRRAGRRFGPRGQQPAHGGPGRGIQGIQPLGHPGEQRREWGERELAVLRRSLQQHVRRLPQELPNQPGLADARLAGHQHHPVPGERLERLAPAHQR